MRLAFQPAAQIERVSCMRYLASTNMDSEDSRSCGEDDAKPLLGQDSPGDLSLSYNRFLGRLILLFNCAIGLAGRIMLLDIPPAAPFTVRC